MSNTSLDSLTRSYFDIFRCVSEAQAHGPEHGTDAVTHCSHEIGEIRNYYMDGGRERLPIRITGDVNRSLGPANAHIIDSGFPTGNVTLGEMRIGPSHDIRKRHTFYITFGPLVLQAKAYNKRGDVLYVRFKSLMPLGVVRVHGRRGVHRAWVRSRSKSRSKSRRTRRRSSSKSKRTRRRSKSRGTRGRSRSRRSRRRSKSNRRSKSRRRRSKSIRSKRR